MPSRFSPSHAAAAAAALALAFLLAFLVHGETRHYGFDYDDYYFLHPHTMDEVLASFHGPWDVTGVMVKFYRPLTVVLSAVRFELFGLNSVAHHTASLAMFAIAATLFAWLAFRLLERAVAVPLAVAFFVAHPAMPYSLVAWVTNQMHLLQILIVLTALVWWDAVRKRSFVWWTPLFLLAVVAFLVKEDGIMLLPAIVVLETLRRAIAGRRMAPPISLAGAQVPVALSIALVLALVAWRSYVLGEMGGYGRPTAERAWFNLSRTLYGVYRLVPADREWQPTASWFATLLPVAAIAAWPWISRGARLGLLSGFAIAITFALPFIFAAKPEQVYLVAAGFALTLAAAAVAMLDLAARSRWPQPSRFAAGAALAAGLAAFVLVARDITRDFEPFGPIVLAHDDIVRTWAVVPSELRDYLERKREPGAAQRLSSNPVDEVAQVTFGVHLRETSPDGVPYSWMSGPRAEIHAAATARAITIPLRHAIEALREPTRVRIVADGRVLDEIAMTTPEWRFSAIALRPSAVPRFSRMHRLRVLIDHAWRPSEIIPGSTDGRVLGLQIGTAAIK